MVWDQKTFKPLIDKLPFLILTLINKEAFIETLVNLRYLLYRVINSRFTRKYNLQYIKITPRELIRIREQVIRRINEVITI